MRDSARDLLRELPVDAVRWGYAQGWDVWAAYQDRRRSPLTWTRFRRACLIGSVLTKMREGRDQVMRELRAAGIAAVGRHILGET